MTLIWSYQSDPLSSCFIARKKPCHPFGNRLTKSQWQRKEESLLMTQCKSLCNKLLATQFILNWRFLTVICYAASNGRTVAENLENECNEAEVICIKFISNLSGWNEDTARVPQWGKPFCNSRKRRNFVAVQAVVFGSMAKFFLLAYCSKLWNKYKL